jgi:hypothetical protein
MELMQAPPVPRQQDGATPEEPESDGVIVGRDRRWYAVPAVVALLAGGVGLLVVMRSDDAEPDPRLLVIDEEGTVSLVDPTTGREAFGVPDAVPSGDLSRLLTAEASDERTVVQGLDASTGAVLGEVEVDGELAIRAVAPRGGSVALTAPRPSGAGVYEPESRSSTDITVADLESGRSHAYRLRGNFEPETFSTDESTLFLLEYWPPLEPDRYFVRQLDIETGAIADVDSPEVELNPEMRGRARAQVMDPDGTFLYTLYTLPRTGEPVYDPEATGDGARWAFVHALDLENEWATCIFLPLPFGQGAESSLNLAISPDGEHVVVADTSTGRLAAIDTGELAVTDTVPVEQLRGEARPSIVVTDDRTSYFSTGWSLVAVDGETLAAEEAWWYDRGSRAAAAPITGLDLSPEGDHLRLAVSSEIVVVDTSTWRVTSRLDTRIGHQIGLLGHPAGTLVSAPLECAC